MKAAWFLAAAALVSAQAGAQVSGFVQLRATQRTGSVSGCSISGCSAMVQEALAEVLFERRLGAHSALAVRADAVKEAISHEQALALREGTIAWQPAANVDLKAGRQIITWGVSDYLVVNDIFPRNYDVFFTGGSFDRMKEPVDAIHLTWHGATDLEFVVSKSKADRMPSPTRFLATGPAAQAVPADDAGDPDLDLALKAAARAGNWDLAAYAASFRSRELREFVDATGLRSDRPRIAHLGISATGNAASGVVWMEAALRHAQADRGNVVDRYFLGSSAKFIAGYSRDLAEDLTATAQVQLEAPLARSRYVGSLAPGVRPVPRFDPLLHLRVQGRWVNQTVGAGVQLFAGAEGDTHVNPFVSWSPADGWTLEAGANLFNGRPDTRFGVLRHDSNVYASARWSW